MQTFNIKEKVEIPANTMVFNSEGKIVDCHFLVKENRDAENKSLVNVKFDFANVSRPELVKLATKSVVIMYQAVIRNAWAEFSNAPEKFERTVDVKTDLLDTERARKSDAEKADSILGKLSPEERAALFAKYQPTTE